MLCWFRLLYAWWCFKGYLSKSKIGKTSSQLFTRIWVSEERRATIFHIFALQRLQFCRYNTHIHQARIVVSLRRRQDASFCLLHFQIAYVFIGLLNRWLRCETICTSVYDDSNTIEDRRVFITTFHPNLSQQRKESCNCVSLRYSAFNFSDKTRTSIKHG